MTEMQIPAFLLRTQPGAKPVTTEPTKTKTRRKDAYCFTLKGKIPLDMANADSLGAAIKAAQGLKDSLPAGAMVEITGSLGKI